MLTKEKAKEILAKDIKDLTPEERKLLKQAVKLVSSTWGLPQDGE